MGSVQFSIVPCSSLYFFPMSIGPFQCLVNANYRVLICFTCHFQSGSLFFVVVVVVLLLLFASLSVSKGSLVQFCCGEGRTPQRNITGMCGECSHCMDHTGFASLTASVLSQSTLLRPQVALQGNCPKQALCFMHFPCLSCLASGSQVKAQTRLGMHLVPFPGPNSSGNKVLGERTVPGGLCILITSLVPAAWFPRYPARVPSQVHCVSL